MAYTQADIDALDEAYKTGARSVRTSDGRMVEYRDVDDYQRLRTMMAESVSGTSNEPRATLGWVSRD